MYTFMQTYWDKFGKPNKLIFNLNIWEFCKSNNKFGVNMSLFLQIIFSPPYDIFRWTTAHPVILFHLICDVYIILVMGMKLKDMTPSGDSSQELHLHIMSSGTNHNLHQITFIEMYWIFETYTFLTAPGFPRTQHELQTYTLNT